VATAPAKWARLLVALTVVGIALSVPAQQASSGNSEARAAAALPSIQSLDAMVQELRYEDLEASLPSLPAEAEHDYFAGILANREGRMDESIQLLRPAIPRIQRDHPAQAAIGLWALADDLVKSYRYREAIGDYETLLAHFRGYLDHTDQQTVEDDYNTIKLLQDAPPQTVSLDGPVRIPTHRGVLGTVDADLTVNGVRASWILDTGANFTAISAGFARRLGVSLSRGEAQTQGITGAENHLRVAILPELKLGSATVHNVVLLVLDDQNLNVPYGRDKHFQIDAVLGFPVFQALGAVTFTRDGWLEAGAASAGTGAKLFMHQLTPLVECSVDGRKLLFSLDTGATASVFSARYYHEFPSAFRTLKKRPYGMAGAGGMKVLSVYYVPQATLGVGETPAVLQHVPVIPSARNTDLDKAYGNLGRDLVAGFRSFTLDFAHMRFALGPRLSPATPSSN
jgi:predicted aspartyl protease